MTDTVILVTRDGMGQAAPELSRKLVTSYLDLLDLDDRVPAAICFYAEGARLACAGSPVLESLADLAGRGTRLLVCGTCLAFLELEDELAVGEVSNMREIQTTQWEAGKVITI
jgi:hypothetical protein